MVGVAELADPEKDEREVRGRQERQEMERLAQSANVKMEQAAQIALAAHPGKLIQKSMGKSDEGVVYTFVVADTPDAEGNASMVVVKGSDGTIVRYDRVFLRTKEAVKEEKMDIEKRLKERPE